VSFSVTKATRDQRAGGTNEVCLQDNGGVTVLKSVIALSIQYCLAITLIAAPANKVAAPGNKSSANGKAALQDPVRPTPPKPGHGSGGEGPGGSFNVDPPKRSQETPEGVRDVNDVLNDARTKPKIPDPIPSTESYCWPGDPKCRKKPAPAQSRPARPNPTPPPRPQRENQVRPELLLASNDGYVEKLMSSAMPYLAHLWSSDAVSTRQEQLATASPRMFASLATKATSSSASASYIWADCSNVSGYADNAQFNVYIYIDGGNVGSTGVEGAEAARRIQCRRRRRLQRRPPVLATVILLRISITTETSGVTTATWKTVETTSREGTFSSTMGSRS
jgi:hypothetical protein